MILSVNPAVLKDIFHKETKALLLSFLKTSIRTAGYFEMMHQIDKQFEKELVICLVDEDYLNAFTKIYNLNGTPVFLLLVNGKEINRFLGQPHKDELTQFIKRNLTNK